MASAESPLSADQPIAKPAEHGTPRRRWSRVGIWYFAIAILTFGVLSAIPFFHAWWKLRDIKVFRFAVLYLFAGVAVYIVVGPPLRLDDPLYGWLTLGVIIASCLQLKTLRRRVYDATAISGIRRFRGAGITLAVTLLAALAAVVLFFVPLSFVLRSTGQREAVAAGSPFVEIWFTAWCCAGVVALGWWSIVEHDPKSGIGTRLSAVTAAMVINIYLGFAIWSAASGWLDIEIAASNPRNFGLMVWWNLLDSIPLLDVDATLDWERPLEEYGADVGWLFLAQRLALLLTLARAIQMLIGNALNRAD